LRSTIGLALIAFGLIFYWHWNRGAKDSPAEA